MLKGTSALRSRGQGAIEGMSIYIWRARPLRAAWGTSLQNIANLWKSKLIYIGLAGFTATMVHPEVIKLFQKNRTGRDLHHNCRLLPDPTDYVGG